MRTNPEYLARNAATTAGGFGDPVQLADDRRTSAVFLRPLHGTPLWAGRVGDLRGSAGSNCRFANLHGSALPFGDGRAGNRNRNWRFAMCTQCQGAPAPVTSVEACRSLFGEHPEDLISPIHSAADALSWLEEILNTIAREALDGRNGYRIKHLAEAGAYLALDMGNYAGHFHETVIARLRDAGVVPTEGDAA